VDTKRDDTSVGFLEEREWYLQMGRPLPLHPILNLRLLDGLQSILQLWSAREQIRQNDQA
jgi:hypothetical protein